MQITLGLDRPITTEKIYKGDAAKSEALKINRNISPEARERVSSFATT
jgi:hypothetical protein